MSDENYFSPAKAGKSEVIEKRSRFIGLVLPVDSEEAAKEETARVKTQYHDARHNCWCYTLRGGVERYSDDGEPQGSAGLPMLEILRRNSIQNACCIVTRYFGGILLGTGGLSRAYSEAAKLALADAGIAEYKQHECMKIICPYSLLGIIKTNVENANSIIEETVYREEVVISIILPKGQSTAINKRLSDISAGAVKGIVTGEKWVAHR